MSEKVIITSNKMGPILLAIVVKKVDFEVAEKSDIRIDDHYMEVF